MNEATPPPLGIAPQPKTSALAIWSLVLGIMAVVFAVVCIGPIVFAIPAIICGHMAYSRIKRSGGQLVGSGMAIAGFATGYASLALIVLMLPIAIPNFVRARDTAQMNMCINNLRQIDGAKNEWALENNKTNGAPVTAADIKPFLKLKTNEDFLKCPAGGTYTIGPVGESPTCSVPKHKLPQ
jgi:hypothetical protein